MIDKNSNKNSLDNSEEVYSRIGHNIKARYSALGSVDVKGRGKPISIYRLLENNEQKN